MPPHRKTSSLLRTDCFPPSFYGVLSACMVYHYAGWRAEYVYLASHFNELIECTDRDPIRHLALVNWDFARTDIIPLVAKIAVLEFRSCRFGHPTDSISSHPGPQTVTFEGTMHIGTLIVAYCTNLLVIQHWIARSTHTSHLKIIGLDTMATLQISPALLVTPGFVEIEFSRGVPIFIR